MAAMNLFDVKRRHLTAFFLFKLVLLWSLSCFGPSKAENSCHQGSYFKHATGIYIYKHVQLLQYVASVSSQQIATSTARLFCLLLFRIQFKRIIILFPSPPQIYKTRKTLLQFVVFKMFFMQLCFVFPKATLSIFIYSHCLKIGLIKI